MITKGLVFGKAGSNTGDSHAESDLFTDQMLWENSREVGETTETIADLTNSMVVCLY